MFITNEFLFLICFLLFAPINGMGWNGEREKKKCHRSKEPENKWMEKVEEKKRRTKNCDTRRKSAKNEEETAQTPTPTPTHAHTLSQNWQNEQIKYIIFYNSLQWTWITVRETKWYIKHTKYTWYMHTVSWARKWECVCVYFMCAQSLFSELLCLNWFFLSMCTTTVCDILAPNGTLITQHMSYR